MLLLYIQKVTIMLIYNNLRIGEKILEKIHDKHQVTLLEIEECFTNREKKFLFDRRVDHQTKPPTRWFISETDQGRLLKIIFIKLFNGMFEIKTAFEPNKTEVDIYEKYAKKDTS